MYVFRFLNVSKEIFVLINQSIGTRLDVLSVASHISHAVPERKES